MSYLDYFQSPIGEIEIRASERGVSHLIFSGFNPHYAYSEKITAKPNAITKQCQQQLDAYFVGKLIKFNIELDMQGTLFQQRVWEQLINIPYGETESYQGIANRIDNPKSVRAVGAANGRNPVSIIVPCHRVIASNGALTGYAGGVDKKEWLLKHESKQGFIDL